LYTRKKKKKKKKKQQNKKTKKKQRVKYTWQDEWQTDGKEEIHEIIRYCVLLMN
jgi:hypothetical protein